jgi:hypothetical protein
MNDDKNEPLNDEDLFKSIFSERFNVKAASSDSTHLVDVESINT